MPSLADSLREPDAEQIPQPAPATQGLADSLRADDDQVVTGLQTAHQQQLAPERATRVLSLTGKTGLPATFIDENLDEVEREAAKQGFDAEAYRRNHPGLSAWMAKNPSHYAFAMKDRGFFESISHAAQTASEGWGKANTQDELAQLAYREFLGETLSTEQKARKAALKKSMKEDALRGMGDSKLSYVTRQVGYGTGQSFLNPRKAERLGTAGLAGATAGAVYGAATAGAPTLGVGAAPGAVAGAGAGFLAGVGAQSINEAWWMETGLAYDEFSEMTDLEGKPMDPAAARKAAAGVGALNAAIETAGDALFLKLIPGAKKLVGEVTGTASVKAAMMAKVREALAAPTRRQAILAALAKIGGASSAEGITEFMQELVGSAGREAGQAMSGQQFAPDSFQDDLTGAAQVGVDTFVGQVFGLGLLPGTAQGLQDAQRIKRAKQAEQFYMALGQGAESESFKALPEATQEALKSITGGTMLEQSYIDPATWTQYWTSKGMDPREVASEVLGDGGVSYDEAVASGVELSIPTERYARKLATTEHHAVLGQELRFNPGELNAREANEMLVATDKAAQEGAPAEMPTAQDGPAQVGAYVEEALLQTGETPDKAASEAKIWESRYRARAERRGQAGMSAMELMKQWPLRIAREGAADLTFDVAAIEADNEAERQAIEEGLLADEQDMLATAQAGGLQPVTDAVNELGGLSSEAMNADGSRAELQDMNNMFKPGGMTPDRMVMALKDLGKVLQAQGIETPGQLFEVLRAEKTAVEAFKNKKGMKGGRYSERLGNAANRRMQALVKKNKELGQGPIEGAVNAEKSVEISATPDILKLRSDVVPSLAEWQAAMARIKQLEKELRTDHMTGLRSAVAYKEDAALGWDEVGALDVDGLGRMNDWFGHEGGNALLKGIGAILKKAEGDGNDVRFYRVHGDEMAARFKKKGMGEQFLARTQDELETVTLELVKNIDGVETVWDYQGLGMSFGIGEDDGTADARLYKQKVAREAAGRRQSKNDPPGAPKRASQRAAGGAEGSVQGGAGEDVPAGQGGEQAAAGLSRLGRFVKKALRLDQAGRGEVSYEQAVKQAESTRIEAAEKPKGSDESYQADLFGQPVPAAPGPDNGESDRDGRVVENARPVVDKKVTIPVSRIKDMRDAAHAFAHLNKNAVEHLAILVADKNGKPLAMVNNTVGGISWSAADPAVYLGEILSIPGAAKAWLGHNHPSGSAALSNEDMAVAQRLWEGLRGTGVEPSGVLAIGAEVEGEGAKYGFAINPKGSPVSAQPLGTPSGKQSKVPIMSRELAPLRSMGPAIKDMADAVSLAKELGRAGVALLNVNRKPVAFIPVSREDAATLRGSGRMEAIYRAVSKSNGNVSIIISPAGEYGDKEVQNLGAFLQNANIKPLDAVVDGRSFVADGKRMIFGETFNQASSAAVPTFFSKLVRTIDEKMPARASVEQVRGLTKDVSADEKKWLGLDEFLKGKQTISKAELQEFLRANDLGIKEVVLGDNAEAKVEERYQELLARFRDDLAREPTAREMASLREDATNDVAEELDGDSETKFGDYQLPGGENYREVLLTLSPKEVPQKQYEIKQEGNYFRVYPEGSKDWVSQHPSMEQAEKSVGASRLRDKMASSSKNDFKSSHWDETNVLAHVRLNDRTDADGKRVLFVEEIQSDWHQKGRKEGYVGDSLDAEITAAKEKYDQLAAEAKVIRDKYRKAIKADAPKDELDALASDSEAADSLREDAGDAVNKLNDRRSSSVPDAPFKKTWHEFAFKRIVRMAAEGGYDRIAWTTGEQQAARYDLANHLSQVDVQENPKRPGYYTIMGKRVGAEYPQFLGNDVIESQLDEYVGKDLANKVLEAQKSDPGKRHIFSGLDLKVGGEGMKGFYDKILVDYAGKFGKKFGAKVGEANLKADSSPEGNLAVFQTSENEDGSRDYIVRAGLETKEFGTDAEAARAFARKHNATVKGPPVHALDLTPALRDAAMTQGFSMFQDPRRGKDARGNIRITPEEALITLGRTADASTFLHESWHRWFFEMAEDVDYVKGLDPATLTPAQKQLVADMDTLLKNVGAPDWASMTEQQQEQLAKYGEAYIMEGKAPNAELRAAFQRFRAWLVSVYRNMTALLQGQQPLNEDVRGVLDRMLATDEQIQAAQAEVSAAPMPGLENDPAYARALAEAREAAEREISTKVMAEWARERAAWWKEEREKLVKESIERHGKERIYKALAFLQHGTNPDGTPLPEGTPTFKLSKESIIGRFSSLRLPKARPYVYQAEDGMDVEMAAEVMGFSSADEMLTALDEAKPLKKLAAEEADDEMKVRHGDMLLDGSMVEEARKAIHNDKRAQLLRMEFEHLAKQEVPALKGLVRKVANRAPRMEVVRAQAETIIARRAVKDIKPITYQRAEAKARREAVDLLLKGDVQEALAAKQKEMLNHELYRAAQAAREDADALVVYMRKLQKPSVREALGKAGGEYLDQLDALAERYSFAPMSTKAVERRQGLRAFLAKMEEQNTPLDVPEDVLNEARQVSYKEVSYEELVGLRDTVKQIEHLARLKNKLLKAGRMRELDAAIDEGTASIEANSKGPRPKEVETRLPQDELLRAGAGFLASHRKMSSLLRQMDGFKDGGIMWELLMRPLNEAGNAEAVANEKATVELKKLFDVYGLADIAKMYQKEFIPGAQTSLTKMGQLMVAFNWGNEDNRTKLLEGYGWTPVQAQAVLERLDERDWKFVQGVWDYIDTYWPETEAMSKRVKGVAPDKVAPAEVSTRFGTFKGGYFPLKYDDRQEPKAYAHLAEEAAKRAMGAGTVRSSTKQGHRKARVEGVKMPVRLDFGVIFEHVAEVIHDQTHYETLIDMNKLLGDRRLQSSIILHHGDQVYRQLTGAVNDIAAGNVPAQQSMERAINYLRVGTTISGLGWNLMTSLMQPLGLTQSMVRVGPKWIAKGLGRWLGDAKRMENTATWIYEKSDLMRLRGKTQQREINEVRNELRLRGKLSSIEDSYFWFIAKGQQLVDIPTWAGSYEKAMADAETDADVRAMTPEEQDARAVALADQAVLDSQGGGQTKDLAQIQRGGPLLKLWTNFYSFFNTTYNLAAESVGRTKWKSPASVGRLGVDMMLLYVAPAMMGLALREALKGKPGDDDDLLEKAVREQVSYIMGSLVLVREVGGAVQGFRGYEGPAGTRAFAEVGRLAKQAEQGELDEAALRALNNVAGILFHYPAGQVDRTVRGSIAAAEGQAGPLAPLFGPPRK